VHCSRVPEFIDLLFILQKLVNYFLIVHLVEKMLIFNRR
jgi:hypothetical protein